MSTRSSRPLAGLAHFLEHMLFMGSDKYPDENEYSAFLAQHGGGSVPTRHPPPATRHPPSATRHPRAPRPGREKSATLMLTA